jgi:hypothetical protein
VQQAFWPNAVITRFLDAVRLEWQPINPFWTIPPVDASMRPLTHESGTLTLHSSVLPTPVIAFRFHYRTPAETASWVYAYPAHTESIGAIRFNVAGGEIRWGVVRNLFGSGYINRGRPSPPVAGHLPGGNAAQNDLHKVGRRLYIPPFDASEDFSVCYGSPEGEPPAFNNPSDGVRDQICFGLKLGSRPLIHDNSAKMRGPEDDDNVVYVDMQQHYGHIPPSCYALKLDPSLTNWCPSRNPQ